MEHGGTERLKVLRIKPGNGYILGADFTDYTEKI